MMKTVTAVRIASNKSQMEMLPQRQIGFFRAISRRTQAVRAESNPGEERHQRDLMKHFRIERILGFSHQQFCE